MFTFSLCLFLNVTSSWFFQMFHDILLFVMLNSSGMFCFIPSVLLFAFVICSVSGNFWSLPAPFSQLLICFLKNPFYPCFHVNHLLPPQSQFLGYYLSNTLFYSITHLFVMLLKESTTGKKTNFTHISDRTWQPKCFFIADDKDDKVSLFVALWSFFKQ